jgi:DNA-directed RNA polymerase subunit RPC12/RpoP
VVKGIPRGSVSLSRLTLKRREPLAAELTYLPARGWFDVPSPKTSRLPAGDFSGKGPRRKWQWAGKSREKAGFVGYEFVAGCGTCGKDFTILWVLDQMRVGPQSVAKITCPACGVRFNQKFSDLIPLEERGHELPTGRPVRTVEVIYDCPSCGMRGISMSLVHTDLSWEDLAKETVQTAVCSNTICARRGLKQKITPGRTRLGALNPFWS